MEKVTKGITVVLFFAMSVFMNVKVANAQKLETVGHVDVSRYSGKWYEVASYPKKQREACHGTTAEYTLCDNGDLIIDNRCNMGGMNGKLSAKSGKAIVKKNTGNAKFKVRSGAPFRGKYWIITLADDYSYAVVSRPNKKSLWILSRTPKMDDAVYKKITEQLTSRGFDLTGLKRTPQT